MTRSQEEPLQRVALLVEQNRKAQSPVGRGAAHQDRIYSAWHRSIKERFTPDQLSALGLGWTQEANALRVLVDSGEVSMSDASAYMRQKYPSQSFASDRFQDQLVDDRSRRLADLAALPTGDPRRVEQESNLLGEIAAQGLQGRNDFVNPQDGAVSTRGVSIPKLGPSYDHRQVMRAIKSTADQINSGVSDVESGNVRLPVNSVDGASITPGTITPEKVDQESFNKMVRDMPGPEESVRLSVARRTDLDADATPTASKGAKRIWQVTDVTYPPNYRPRPGPMRVTVVNKGMQFNCMSIDGGAKAVSVRYGLVLKGIPHFLGRIPQQILYAVSSGYSPGQVEAVHQNGTSSVGPDALTYSSGQNTILYDSLTATTGRAYEDFVTRAPGWLAEHGSSSNIKPSSTDVAKADGVKFMLITGTTAKEVYSQLNSKQVNGAYIGGNSQGPTASLPPGRVMESPAPACGSVQTSDGSNELTVRIRTSGSESAKWRIAYPFSYESCSQLVATRTHFSLVVMPDLAHQDAGVDTVSFDINDMSSNGVTVVSDNDRTVGVDIVVV
tara:strand:- start:431 stop:2098 length:1668 start_codon:yes stop_codon:yes gene_type:complete